MNLFQQIKIQSQEELSQTSAPSGAKLQQDLPCEDDKTLRRKQLANSMTDEYERQYFIAICCGHATFDHEDGKCQIATCFYCLGLDASFLIRVPRYKVIDSKFWKKIELQVRERYKPRYGTANLTNSSHQ